MRKKITSNRISVVASIVILGLVSFSGCSSSSNHSSAVAETATIDLSGSVIDGYVSGADIIAGSFSAVSNGVGFWSIPDVEESDSLTIEASGGTDTSTGEPFEGKLKASVAKGQTTANVTPLSTIVTSVVESGVSVEEANTVVSTQLGISEEALAADPIETLKSGTPAQKTEAAKAIKTALVVQKMAETISKSAGANTADQNEIFDAVMDSVATQLQSNLSFDEVMADTATITTATAVQVTAQDSTIENLSEKLAASAASASEVVKMVQAIDETSLAESTDVTASMLATGKALEVVTAAVERAMVKVAEATDVESIVLVQAEATKTTQAITMLGGVEGIAATIKTQEATLVAGNVIDSSSFSESMFSETAIEEQAAVYVNLADLGMTAEMITQVGTDISTAEAGVDVAAVVAAVIAATPDVVISTEDQEAMSALVTESVELAVAVVEVATEVSQGIDENPPVVEEPVVEEPVVEEPVVEEPVVEEEETVINTGGSTTVSNTATATFNTTLDNLNATATLTDTNITVTNILDSTTSPFSVTRTKISLATTGTPTLTQKYDAIKDNLGSYLDIDLSVASVPGTFDTRTEQVTILVKTAGTDFVAISTEASFIKNGDNLTVDIAANAVLRMAARIDSATTLTATRTNLSSNLISSNGTTIAFNTASAIKEFAENALIGDYIKENMVKYTTETGTYSVYLLINKTSDSTSFINDTNSVAIDSDMETILDTLVSGTSVNYTTSHRAIQVNLTVE